MGKHRYNHSLRKQQQQPASANNFFPSQVQAQARNHKEPLEGINVRGQAHNINQGGEVRRSRGHARNDRRSKSPEQKNYPDKSRPQHHNNSVPLPSMICISRHNTSQARQACKGEVSTPVRQPSAKRKRDNTANTADDQESQRSNKKAHTSSEDMVPTICQKAVTGLVAITKLSEEDRQRLRAAKFGSKTAAQTKATTVPSEVTKDTNHRVADRTSQDGHKPTLTRAKSPALHNHVINAPQKGVHVTRSDIKTQEQPSSKNDAPKQKTVKAKSATPEKKVIEPKTSTPPPSLEVVSNIASTPSKKRKSDDAENTVSSSSKKTKSSFKSSSKLAPVTQSVIQANIEKRTAKLKDLMGIDWIGEVEYPQKTVEYVDYSIYSIPVLYSTFIEHEYEFEPIDKPPEDLKKTMTESEIELFGRKMLLIRQAALRLTNKKKRRLSEVLGRKDVPMSGPLKVIEDCDLYLHDDKIHVATEHGLLTVPNYLELIKIPETQPVRFEGRKPSWMKQVLERRVCRRAAIHFDPSDILLAEGCIMLPSEAVLIVLDQGIFDINIANGEESRMAYGFRVRDGVEGWFPYEATCRIDWLQEPGEETKPDPNVIDWSTFDYGPAARAATLRQQGKTPDQIAATEAATTATMTTVPAQAAANPTPASPVSQASAPGLLTSPVIQADETAQHLDEVPSLTTESEGSTSRPASPQSCQSQAETIPMSSAAAKPLSQQDSPQTISQQTMSGGSRDSAKENYTPHNSATVTNGNNGTADTSRRVLDTPLNAFTKPRNSLPGFPGSTKPSWKEEDDVDYDDDEL